MFISDHDVHSTNRLKGERIEFSRRHALVFLLLLKGLQRAPHVSRANFQISCNRCFSKLPKLALLAFSYCLNMRMS